MRISDVCSFVFCSVRGIVPLATQENGRVRAVAKGVRKTRSRFGARLEPLSHVALQLYEGRNLDTITQVEGIDAFRAIRDDLDRYASAMTVLEVVDQLAMEGESDRRRFRMLVGVLRTLAENDNPLVVPAFELKVLAHERSEEHTSELQSLMRISYAVFCLKKKKTQ